MQKKLIIPIYVLMAGLVVWGFINPNGIRGAWANNSWSISFIENYFNVSKSFNSPLSPPQTHSHAELFLTKLALNQGDYPLALKHISPLLSNSDPVILSIYADLLYRTKDYAGAISAWQQAGDVSSLTKATIEARENNQPDLVIHAFQSLQSINAEVYTRPLASELIGNQDYQNAIILLEKTIAEYPQSDDYATWFAQLGSAYLALERWPEAKMAYEQAVQENPEGWIAWRNLGWIHYDFEKNAEKAIACFEKVIVIVPDRKVGYDDIKSIFQMEGDLTKALDWYENALIDNPDNIELRMAYADFLRQNDEPERAISIYLEIISQFPDYENSYFEISRVYLENNQQTLAIQNIKNALKLAPNNVQFLLRAGTIYEQSGLTKEALEAYKAALEIEPNNIHAQNGVDHLSDP